MSLQYAVRPISDRTAFGGPRQGSLFTVKWHQVLELLEREYDLLNGKHLVIEVDVTERGIRNDGLLRADAKASSPAARVAFESKHGPVIMATDRFVRQSYRSASMDDWQHNVYAIAKSLEALRMVDRYGVTKRGEQYRGFKAIGAGSGDGATGMTTDDALAVLRAQAPQTKRDEPLDRLLRWAKAGAHPDRHDGDRSRWNGIDEAEQVLRRAGRLS